MGAKVINVKDYEKRAFNLYFKRVEEGDLLGALDIMYPRYIKNPNDKEVVLCLANLYSKMEEYVRALFFRFKYLSLTQKEDRISVYKDIVLEFDAFDNVVLTNYYLSRVFEEYGRSGVASIAVELGEKLNNNPALDSFYVAYPENEKYYKRMLTLGRHALGALSGDIAQNYFSKVPLKYFDDSFFKDYLTVFMINEDYEGGLKKLKEYREVFGETVLYYSNSSMFYTYLKNQEKSKYYLDMAISIFNGEEENAHDIYEAIKGQTLDERFIKIFECLSKAYKYNAEFHYNFYQLLTNCDNIERAKEELKLARLIEPENPKYLSRDEEIGVLKSVATKNAQKVKVNSLDITEVESARYLLYGDSIKVAKGMIYSIIEQNKPSLTRVLSDALLDLEFPEELKFTAVFAKITFKCLDIIPVVIDGRYYEVRPKKLVKGAQEIEFYRAVYGLTVSKTFSSGLCTENDLKVAVNTVYKTFKDVFFGDKDLKDVATVVCRLALKDFELKRLVSTFDSNLERVEEMYKTINKVIKND